MAAKYADTEGSDCSVLHLISLLVAELYTPYRRVIYRTHGLKLVDGSINRPSHNIGDKGAEAAREQVVLQDLPRVRVVVPGLG